MHKNIFTSHFLLKILNNFVLGRKIPHKGEKNSWGWMSLRFVQLYLKYQNLQRESWTGKSHLLEKHDLIMAAHKKGETVP